VTKVSSRWVVAISLGLVSALAACGGSTTTAASSPAVSAAPVVTPVPTPVTTTAPVTCPTAATVGSALGITVPKPVGISGGGGTPLPAGATAEACDYHASSFNVIIELITNIDPSYIAQFSSHFPVAFVSVPGVGDQARSFTVTLGGGKVNEGVVATKGKHLVDITATATPASLAQVETLVNQLL
jgi:hypothetical protein